MTAYRYCYHNRAYRQAGHIHGQLCEPAWADAGRCVITCRLTGSERVSHFNLATLLVLARLAGQAIG